MPERVQIGKKEQIVKKKVFSWRTSPSSELLPPQRDKRPASCSIPAPPDRPANINELIVAFSDADAGRGPPVRAGPGACCAGVLFF